MNKTWNEQMTEARALGPVTAEELAAFVAAVSDNVFNALKAAYPTCDLNWERIEHKGGTKFAKLVRVHPVREGGSAYCFIDLTNGDILKPAGWKAPAKHARGNIRLGAASNWWNDALNYIGAAYLR